MKRFQDIYFSFKTHFIATYCSRYICTKRKNNSMFSMFVSTKQKKYTGRNESMIHWFPTFSVNECKNYCKSKSLLKREIIQQFSCYLIKILVWRLLLDHLSFNEKENIRSCFSKKWKCFNISPVVSYWIKKSQ